MTFDDEAEATAYIAARLRERDALRDRIDALGAENKRLREVLQLGLAMANEAGPFPDYARRDAFRAAALRVLLGEKGGGK